MKHFLTILVTLVNVCYAFSQNQESLKQIRKFYRDSDYISITTTDIPDSAFLRVSQLFKLNQIPIAYESKAHYYLVSEFHELNGFTIRFRARVKRYEKLSKIFFRCEYRSGQTISEAYSSFDLLLPRIGEGLVNNRCFALMYEFAMQYPNRIKSKNKIELDRWIPNRTKELVVRTGMSKEENIELIKSVLSTYNLGTPSGSDSIFRCSEIVLDEALDDESFDTEMIIFLKASAFTITLLGLERDESFLSAMIGGSITWTSDHQIIYEDYHGLKIRAFRELFKLTEYIGNFELEYITK